MSILKTIVFRTTERPPKANIQKVPPTNGWMVELGYGSPQGDSEGRFECGYRLVDGQHSDPFFFIMGPLSPLLGCLQVCSTESTFPATR